MNRFRGESCKKGTETGEEGACMPRFGQFGEQVSVFRVVFLGQQVFETKAANDSDALGYGLLVTAGQWSMCWSLCPYESVTLNACSWRSLRTSGQRRRRQRGPSSKPSSIVAPRVLSCYFLEWPCSAERAGTDQLSSVVLIPKNSYWIRGLFFYLRLSSVQFTELRNCDRREPIKRQHNRCGGDGGAAEAVLLCGSVAQGGRISSFV